MSRNKDTRIIKQDKGRGEVFMDRGKYLDKYLAILNTEQFEQLEKDPTSSLERKVQCMPRKIRQKLSKDVYAKLYPTESSVGKFYGTAKVHKLAINDTVKELLLRPITLNLNNHYISVSMLFGKNIIPSELFTTYCRK